jgi:lambda family phage portal protein
MNWLDRMIAAISPRAGFERSRYRAILASYDAAQPSHLRKFSRESRSGESIARVQAKSVREQARHFDRNHDLARGALTVMVNNIVGPAGIGIEPQPRSVSGEILEDVAQQLLELYRDWRRYPEVTYQHNWAATQRLGCRTWLRDGECFAQILEGDVPGLNHRTSVPLSLELLEPDMVPTENEAGLIDGRGGIILNGWGQPVSYRVYKAHPGDTFNWRLQNNLKTIPADRMLHASRVDRIGQVRGVSDFASVITRLEDLKDYEESERIAAKIAASMAGFIRKGTPDLYDPQRAADGTTTARNMRFQPGMIFDDLIPGEEIGTIDTNRPNSNLGAHRDGQLRAVAAGIGASYSSISRNYNGTYSAQRQELVEQWVHYQTLADAFTAQFVAPVWERFVFLAFAAGLLNLPGDLDPRTLDDAMYIGQTMPWIDPLKEANANEVLERNVYKSAPEIIRARGGNPKDVLDQESKWRRQLAESGLSQIVATAQPAAEPDEDTTKKDDDEQT